MHTAYDVICSMHIETNIEKVISKKVRDLTRQNIITIELERQIPNIGTIDFRLSDDQGQEYIVEIKNKRITKFDVGQLVTYATLVRKEIPSIRIFLVSKKVSPIHKEILKKIGIEIIESDLGLTLNETSQNMTPEIGKRFKLSPKEQESYFLLLKRGIVVITPESLSEKLIMSYEYSKNLLAKLAEKNVLARFGRGKYVVIPPDVIYDRRGYSTDPMLILGALMDKEQYYLAYTSALYIHGLSYQLPFETFVAVTKQRRSVKVGNSMIKFIQVGRSRMFAYQERKYLNSYVVVSELEKTIIDCIDRHDLCGGISEVSRNISECLKQLDGKKLFSYIRKFSKQVVVQRLGFILDKLNSAGYEVDPKLLNDMRALTFGYFHRLDSTQPRKGETSKEWKIIENVDCLNWRNA